MNYNSQLWRKDGGATWKLGRDIGYGFGWRLQAGSITPYWSEYWTIHHYTFIDSSGAEYRLDVNTNGVWTSKEGIYVSYVPSSNCLYLPDGSFWVMGCVSAGTEQDAGTRYPTLMQDTNGNQIVISYNPGVAVFWEHSSARIKGIKEVRAPSIDTYTFTYNSDPISHLTEITQSIGSPEKYVFSYLGSQNLNSPFSPSVAFGTTSLLSSVTVNGLGLTHQFEYAASGSGELVKVRLPYGGHLRWAYRDFTYSGSRIRREVQYRYLAPSSGACEVTHTFSRDEGDSSRTAHSLAYLDGPGGQVTVQAPPSIFLDKSPRIVYRMVDECENGSPRKATRSSGGSP